MLSISDLSAEDVRQLIQSAAALKRGVKKQYLKGKAAALLFEKPSLRTRVSFEIALWQLGGYAVYLSPAEVGLGKREQIPDVARTLSRYVQAIVARTFSQQTVESLARYATVPVINALSDMEHPCQALGDLLTIYEKKDHFPGLKLAYIGDANNVANSLLLAASLVGVDFRIASPSGYGLQDQILKSAQRFASKSGASITCVSDPKAAVDGADVVYTDVWVSMGQEAESKARLEVFRDYQVTERLLSVAKKDVIFMHPLPAHHGEEVAVGLLDHPRSVVFDQAENRLHIQKAILVELLRNG